MSEVWRKSFERMHPQRPSEERVRADQNEALVETALLTELTNAEKRAIEAAAESFGKFPRLSVSTMRKQHSPARRKARSVQPTQQSA